MKKKLGLFFITMALAVLTAFPAFGAENYSGFVHNGSTIIPVRGVFEAMGAKVNWLAPTREVVIEKGNLKITLQVDNKKALVNGEWKELATPPMIREGSTYLPLRFPSEAMGAEVNWNDATGIATIDYQNQIIIVTTKQPNTNLYSEDKLSSFTKKINGTNVVGVIIPKGLGLKPKLALANGQVGTTQSLEDMAKANNALVAVNGSFFGAYGGVPVPWNQLIKDGNPVHLGNTGSTFGFTKDGKAKLETLRLKILGATEGSYNYPNGWYAFGLNHYPNENGNLAYLFTSAWGKELGFNHGKQIVVENGKVTKIVDGENVAIPINGYVISLHGSEKYLESRFELGTSVSYKLQYTNLDGNDVNWDDVVTGVGAGPGLVRDGKIIVNPEREGFTEAKILTQALFRSAIGITATGDVILINTTATVQKLAEIMVELGAIHAMNLDGGASAGIYLNGKYLTKPGRNLSNALIFVQ